MLEKEKNPNNSFKQTWTKMYGTIKNLRFYFMEAMALKFVKPEDQYKSDLKSY